MTSNLPKPIEWLCRNDLLLPLAEQYVRECSEAVGQGSASGKRKDSGGTSAFDPRIHALRPQRGQSLVAKNIRMLLADSPIIEDWMY